MAGDQVTRLNLGCGGQIVEGWVNVDREFVGDPALAGVRLDITKTPWGWSDESVDGIVLHHVLDLMDEDAMMRVLRECHRVLKKGATLRISSADHRAAMEACLRGDIGWFPEPDERGIACSLGWFIHQGGARKQILDPARVADALTSAGFARVEPSFFGVSLGPDWMTDLDSRPDESWWLEAFA